MIKKILLLPLVFFFGPNFAFSQQMILMPAYQDISININGIEYASVPPYLHLNK